MNEDLSHLTEPPLIKMAKMESIEKDAPETLVDSDVSTDLLTTNDTVAPAPVMPAPSHAPHLKNATADEPKLVAPVSTKWNQNKKIPRIYPGIIISGLTFILIGSALIWRNWIIGGIAISLILLGAVYWTFCVFRITGQLKYKSKSAKIFDRTLALFIPLLVNPGVMSFLFSL